MVAPPQGYVYVAVPDGKELSTKEVEDDKKATLSAGVKLALSRHLRASKDPVRVRLASWYPISSSAATILNAVQALSPIGVTDFSSFAAVYDLWRVKSLHVMVRTDSSGAMTGSADWGLAWDPVNIGTYSSLADILTAKTHIGPFVICGANSLQSPQSFTSNGFHSMHCKLVPTKLTNDSTAVNAVGGGWVGTSNATAVVGWLKPFCASLGGSLISSMSIYVVYDVEFKSRT